MEYIIDEKNDGRKIEYILSGEMKLSGGMVKKLKASDGVLLNGEKVKLVQKAFKGDRLEIILPKEIGLSDKGESTNLDIVYEDDDIIVVNKPANMPCHTSRGHMTGTMENALKGYFGEGFIFRCITRLDKDTTGLVLAAKNPIAAQRLNSEMKEGRIMKEYAAVVCGSMPDKKGVIIAPIKRGEGIKRVVDSEGKEAVSEYEVLSEHGRLCFVKLMPLTGRTHQLRVHLGYIGAPIYGDWLYGEENGRCRLHARRLEFEHPVNKKRMCFEAELPEDIKKLLC